MPPQERSILFKAVGFILLGGIIAIFALAGGYLVNHLPAGILSHVFVALLAFAIGVLFGLRIAKRGATRHSA